MHLNKLKKYTGLKAIAFKRNDPKSYMRSEVMYTTKLQKDEIFHQTESSMIQVTQTMQPHQRLNMWAQKPKCRHNAPAKWAPKVSASNFLPLSKVKTTCTFTWCWSIHLITTEFLNESAKDHICILCANEASQNNKANLPESIWPVRVRTLQCSPATFLNATLVQSIRTTRKLFNSSALSGSSEFTFQTFNLYKDYKSRSWSVDDQCWCCSFAANVVFVLIFSLIISYLCIFSESMNFRDGQGRAELGIGGCCCGPWAQKSGPTIGWTTSQQQCANFCEFFIAYALIFNAM